jgi:hypothetical protein
MSGVHTTDAEFRAWGKNVSDHLQAMSGLVKTADTGQINWTTVTIPGANTDAGYEIYYLNDSLFATAPIYMRIAYGTATTAPRARMRLTVGTGTDGAGAITGTALATVQSASTPVTLAAAPTFPSWLSVSEGFFALSVLWIDTSGIAVHGFIVCRSCDTNGTPDATAAMVYTHGGGNTSSIVRFQSLRFATTAATYISTNTGYSVLVPHFETSTSQITGVPQAYHAWHITPYMSPLHAVAGVLNSETLPGATCRATLVGSTERTYMNWGNFMGAISSYQTAASVGTLVLWE